MRSITLIVVHCSANRAGSALRLADIDRHHRSLGWKGCGYHYVIPTDGTLEEGRPEAEEGASNTLQFDTPSFLVYVLSVNYRTLSFVICVPFAVSVRTTTTSLSTLFSVQV